jgi:hypothetical protein
MLAATAIASLAYLAVIRVAFKPVWADLRMIIERVVPPLARLAERLRRPRRLVPAASDGGVR